MLHGCSRGLLSRRCHCSNCCTRNVAPSVTMEHFARHGSCQKNSASGQQMKSIRGTKGMTEYEQNPYCVRGGTGSGAYRLRLARSPLAVALVWNRSRNRQALTCTDRLMRDTPPLIHLPGFRPSVVTSDRIPWHSLFHVPQQTRRPIKSSFLGAGATVAL